MDSNLLGNKRFRGTLQQTAGCMPQRAIKQRCTLTTCVGPISERISRSQEANGDGKSSGFVDLSSGILHLPPTHSSLSQLHTLRLRNNLFWEFPLIILNMRQLKELDISGCYLGRLPDHFGDLSSLEILDLSNNALYSIPESFAKLQNLKELHLGYNALREVPGTLWALKALKRLYLPSNTTRVLPEVEPQFKKLEDLNLCDNNLDRLPEKLACLKHLRTFDLGCNMFQIFPKVISNYRNLQSLNLSGNSLFAFPFTEMRNLSEIRNLNLSHNPWSRLRKEVEISHRLVDLRGMQIEGQKKKVFESGRTIRTREVLTLMISLTLIQIYPSANHSIPEL